MDDLGVPFFLETPISQLPCVKWLQPGIASRSLIKILPLLSVLTSTRSTDFEMIVGAVRKNGFLLLDEWKNLSSNNMVGKFVREDFFICKLVSLEFPFPLLWNFRHAFDVYIHLKKRLEAQEVGSSQGICVWPCFHLSCIYIYTQIYIYIYIELYIMILMIYQSPKVIVPTWWDLFFIIFEFFCQQFWSPKD